VRADSDENVPAEGDHARGRQIDAGLHDHEHLTERGDGKDRHVREDERPGRAPQRRGRDHRRDDQEHDRRDPDGQEASTDERVGDRRRQHAPATEPAALGAGRRAHGSSTLDAPARRPFSGTPRTGVNHHRTIRLVSEESSTATERFSRWTSQIDGVSCSRLCSLHMRGRRAAHPVSARQEGRGMSAQRLLIRNGFVVSMDPDVGEIPNGEVFVEDGKIVEIGRGLSISDAEEVDAAGMIVMPGFVDTHRHTWQTPVRGVLPSCTLDHYFAVMLGQVGGFYRPEDVHIGDYAGSLEALNAGVTTLLDWSHISNTPDHSDAAIQGLKDAGIRAVYAHGVPTGGEWWSFSDLNHPEDIRRIRETYFSSDDGLITLAMAARQPGNSNFEVAKHDWALARELDILISVHVGMRLHNLHYE